MGEQTSQRGKSSTLNLLLTDGVARLSIRTQCTLARESWSNLDCDWITCAAFAK